MEEENTYNPEAQPGLLQKIEQLKADYPAAFGELAFEEAVDLKDKFEERLQDYGDEPTAYLAVPEWHMLIGSGMDDGQQHEISKAGRDFVFDQIRTLIEQKERELKTSDDE